MKFCEKLSNKENKEVEAASASARAKWEKEKKEKNEKADKDYEQKYLDLPELVIEIQGGKYGDWMCFPGYTLKNSDEIYIAGIADIVAESHGGMEFLHYYSNDYRWSPAVIKFIMKSGKELSLSVHPKYLDAILHRIKMKWKEMR